MNNPPRRLQTTLLPQLDGLRGIAVLLVLWFHFPFIAGSPGSQAFTDVGHKIRSGTIGVDVFFALSEFLITRILINERVMTGTISFSNFYFKRSLRIFPAYYICIIFCIIMFRLPDQEIVYNLLYLTNYNLANYMPNNDHSNPLAHTWSLAVEEQFYLLWPLLLAFVPLRHIRMTTAVVVPAIAVGTMVLTCLFVSTLQADALIFGAAPIRMLTLSFGAYLACREHDRSPLSGRSGYALIVLAVCWLFAAQVAREWGYTTSPVYHSLGNVGFAFFGAGCARLDPSTPLWAGRSAAENVEMAAIALRWPHLLRPLPLSLRYLAYARHLRSGCRCIAQTCLPRGWSHVRDCGHFISHDGESVAATWKAQSYTKRPDR